MSRFLFVFVVLCGVAGCVELGDEEVTESADQGVSLTFRLRSALVPAQIMDTLGATSGSFARLVPVSAAPDQQRWFFDGVRLHSNQQQGLCLQPEGYAMGARILLRPCNVNEPLQLWAGVKMPNNRVQMQNGQTYGCIDASAGAFGILRQQPRSTTSVAQLFTIE